jgi:alpha-mannosidase
LWENSSELHALAGGQVDKKLEDKGVLGIFGQNGQQSFFYNFALTTHKGFDAITAMKFSLEHQNPLSASWIYGENGGTQNNYSLLSINTPNVLLWSVKPAEDGISKGLITRFWNMDSKPLSPVVRLSKPIHSASQTTHVETDELILKPINGVLKAEFNQFQMKSYRLKIN